jgi:hypothetical protein
MTRMGSPAQEVARIRVAAERLAADALMPEYRLVKTHFRPEDHGGSHRDLLSTALHLTESMAPAAYAIGRDVMATLGVDGGLALYQSRWGDDNAQLVLHGDPRRMCTPPSPVLDRGPVPSRMSTRSSEGSSEHRIARPLSSAD